MQQSQTAIKERAARFSERIMSTPANTDETLAEISAAGKTLVVFLRHGGCTFCREALEDLRVSRGAIDTGSHDAGP
jgi:hypothetical protein